MSNEQEDNRQPVQAKHTPGPWMFDYRLGVVSHAEMNQCDEPVQIALEVRYSDGSLIAAAPDMYEALASIEDNGSIPPAIWKIRNNALAKARGEL